MLAVVLAVVGSVFLIKAVFARKTNAFFDHMPQLPVAVSTFVNRTLGADRPGGRHRSLTGTPASTSRRKPMICAWVNRFCMSNRLVSRETPGRGTPQTGGTSAFDPDMPAIMRR
jgi:hypothetical protein